MLATDLREPVGVAIDADGRAWWHRPAPEPWSRSTDRGSRPSSPTSNARKASWCATACSNVDAGAKKLIAFDLNTHVQQTIAAGLPVGPLGRGPQTAERDGAVSGPQGRFAGIAAAADGTLYISADGDGSILALRRTQDVH